MKRFLLIALAAASLYGIPPAKAADYCPHAFVLNGSGSPPVVAGNTVQLVIRGTLDFSSDLNYWVDGVPYFLWMPWLPPGTFVSEYIVITLPDGNHTLHSPFDPGCTVNFSVVPPPPPPPPPAPSAAPSLSLTPGMPIRVYWAEVPYSAGYEVQVDGGTVSTTTFTSFTLLSLMECESAMVRARGVNITGTGPWSSWKTVYRPPSGPTCPDS